jgi:hypothetical protein
LVEEGGTSGWKRSEKEEEDKEKLRSREEKGKKAIFLSSLMGTQILHMLQVRYLASMMG